MPRKKILEIIEYFQPEKWWLETPRTGLLARREFMKHFPYVDCDYCQFVESGFQKPTRFFGSPQFLWLNPRVCDGKNCRSLVEETDPPPNIREGIVIVWEVEGVMLVAC